MVTEPSDAIASVEFRAYTPKGFFGRAMLMSGSLDVPNGTPEEVRQWARLRLREIFTDQVTLEIHCARWERLD